MLRTSPIKRLGQTVHSDTGAIALIVAIAIFALMGVTALATDAGYLYSHRRELQNAADAAALAGVRDLPSNPVAAKSEAANYVALNTKAADSVITSSTVSTTWATNDTITVEVIDPDAPYFFGRAIGLTTTKVSAKATAMVGSPVTYNRGVMPFAVTAIDSLQSPFGYVNLGMEVDLKVAGGEQTKGNYHYVDLGPFSNFTNPQSIIEAGGSSKPITIGDFIYTQPGARENPVFKELADFLSNDGADPPHSLAQLYRDPVTGLYEPKHLDGTPCRRLVVTPVIVIADGDPFNWAAATGTTKTKVIGFLNMFIANDPEFKSTDPTIPDGALRVRFVQAIPSSAVSPGPVTPFAGLITWLDR